MDNMNPIIKAEIVSMPCRFNYMYVDNSPGLSNLET